nr:hypothetical protein [Tanacetum cinerariifolium]
MGGRKQENQQQIDLDEVFIPGDDQVKIGACNIRIAPEKKQKEPTYQLALDIFKRYSCYNAFLKTVDVPKIYMQQFSDDEEVKVLSSNDERNKTDGSEKPDKEKARDKTTKEEKTRDEKVEEEEAKNEKAAEEEVVKEQARNQQTGVIIPEPQQEKPTLLTSSTSNTLSSAEYNVDEANVQGNKHTKKRRHDNQDPPTDAYKESKKRKRNDADTSSSKKELIQDDVEEDDALVQDDDMDADDMPHDDVAPTQGNPKWFKKDDVDLVMFDDLMGSTADFTKFAKHYLKKDNITDVDLEGPTFKLLNGGNYRNYIKLEYNMKHCYLDLIDQIDWVNLVGDRFPYDLSKPLPLQGPPSRTTFPDDFFFNKDLEYLMTRNTENKYASSLTKPKAARERNRHLHVGREGVSIVKGNSYIDAGRKALGGSR